MHLANYGHDVHETCLNVLRHSLPVLASDLISSMCGLHPADKYESHKKMTLFFVLLLGHSDTKHQVSFRIAVWSHSSTKDQVIARIDV